MDTKRTTNDWESRSPLLRIIVSPRSYRLIQSVISGKCDSIVAPMLFQLLSGLLTLIFPLVILAAVSYWAVAILRELRTISKNIANIASNSGSVK